MKNAQFNVVIVTQQQIIVNLAKQVNKEKVILLCVVVTKDIIMILYTKIVKNAQKDVNNGK